MKKIQWVWEDVSQEGDERRRERVLVVCVCMQETREGQEGEGGEVGAHVLGP